MSNIEKRISVDDSTERVFQYASQPQASTIEWPGLIEVRDVHRLIDGVSYTNWVYQLTGTWGNDLMHIRLEFESDQTALIAQLRKFEPAMTWKFQSDRAAGSRLALDGDHTYWAQC
jgi:hypothetical protein